LDYVFYFGVFIPLINPKMPAIAPVMINNNIGIV